MSTQKESRTASGTRRYGWKRAVGLGVAVPGTVAISLVVWTWAIGGRAIAERCATDLAMPIAVLWLLMLAGGVTAFLFQRRDVAVVCAFVFLFISLAFNPILAGALFRATEFKVDVDPISTVGEKLDAVVLLGGYAVRNELGTPQVSTDGQRLVTTARLWHSGKTKTIICTGSAHLGDNHPSILGRELLTSLGVPEGVIFEVPGENTNQEMQSLRAFFAKPPRDWSQIVGSGGDRIALVTSAYHLSRALRLAQTQDLEFIPIPCGFSGAEGHWTPQLLIPNVGAGKRMANVCKSYLAYLVGR